MNAQAAPFSGNEPGFMAQSESKCLHRTAPVPGGGMRRRGSLISGISTGAQTRTIGRPGFYSGGGSKCSHQTAPVPGGGMRHRGSCVSGIPNEGTDTNNRLAGICGAEASTPTGRRRYPAAGCVTGVHAFREFQMRVQTQTIDSPGFAGRKQVPPPDGAGTRQRDASLGFMRFGNSK